MKSLFTLALSTALVAASMGAAQAAEDVLIVYDASGSMWGQIDGVNKIVTAREVMADLVRGWPEDTNLGLVAYGHRSAGDCADIETLVEPQPVDRQAFINTVNAINPKGKTPIADSLRHAANVLQYRDNNATVVLISDGLESCHGDPCAVAAELEASGVDFTAHVVGFDLDEAGNQALACIADNTGGIFVPASNADELKSALQQVQARVVQKEPELEQPPEPEPEPAEPEYDVGISAPEQITAGARFDVSWTQSINNRDWVQIVPAGHPEGKLDNYIRVENKQQGQLTAPGQAGMYEVRYVLNQGGKTLAHAPLEVVESEIGISAPEQVNAGARFDVSWTQSINNRDWVQIVPAGHPEGKLDNYIRVENKQQGQLTAPGQAGMYEVRYVLNQGGKTLAHAPLEVVESEIGISAPEQVNAGARFDVSWTQSINNRDWVQIVPAGHPEGKLDNYIRVENKQQGQLTAPGQTGMYEVRYVLNQGGKTLAHAPVEVLAEDATLDFGAGLQAPAKARPGETITVSWSGGSDGKDQRVTLAKADAADFTWIAAHKVGEQKSQSFTLPDEPGRYEVRYLDVGNTAVLGRAIVEVQ